MDWNEPFDLWLPPAGEKDEAFTLFFDFDLLF